MRKRLAHLGVESPEPLFGEREEDVVLAGEIAVDGGGAVLDPLGDLANGNVAVALGDEEVASGVEDGFPNGLPFAVLSFFDTHALELVPSVRGDLNSVRRSNGV